VDCSETVQATGACRKPFKWGKIDLAGSSMVLLRAKTSAATAEPDQQALA